MFVCLQMMIWAQKESPKEWKNRERVKEVKGASKIRFHLVHLLRASHCSKHFIHNHNPTIPYLP